MADIYSNSYCNIPATHNRSCDDGLFLERDLKHLGMIYMLMCTGMALNASNLVSLIANFGLTRLIKLH